MIKYLTIIMLLIAMPLQAEIIQSDGMKIIKYEKRGDNNSYFLMGTERGSYIINSWDIAKTKVWSGSGEPDFSIGKAIEISKKHLKNNKLLFKKIDLYLAINNSKEIIWYYTLTFVEDLFNPRAKKHDVVILTSGEIVQPWNISANK